MKWVLLVGGAVLLFLFLRGRSSAGAGLTATDTRIVSGGAGEATRSRIEDSPLGQAFQQAWNRRRGGKGA